MITIETFEAEARRRVSAYFLSRGYASSESRQQDEQSVLHALGLYNPPAGEVYSPVAEPIGSASTAEPEPAVADTAVASETPAIAPVRR